jgi:hypothetical protein
LTIKRDPSLPSLILIFTQPYSQIIIKDNATLNLIGIGINLTSSVPMNPHHPIIVVKDLTKLVFNYCRLLGGLLLADGRADLHIAHSHVQDVSIQTLPRSSVQIINSTIKKSFMDLSSNIVKIADSNLIESEVNSEDSSEFIIERNSIQ